MFMPEPMPALPYDRTALLFVAANVCFGSKAATKPLVTETGRSRGFRRSQTEQPFGTGVQVYLRRGFSAAPRRIERMPSYRLFMRGFSRLIGG